MTVPSTTRRAGPYLGNGVTTSFPFAFKVFEKTDVSVILTDGSGSATTLVLDSNYSVTLNADQDANPGGSITYPALVGPAPLPIGSTLTMIGGLAAEQSTDLTNGGRYLPEVIENALDKLTILIQQLKEVSSRTLQAAVGTTVSLIFPAPSSGKFIRWRSDLLGLENVDGGTDSMALQGLLADAGDVTHGAALIGYKLNATGATGRTLAAELRERISVKNFGAVGDGVADDTAALQAAINFCVANGLELHLPPGTFKHSGLTVSGGLTMTGSGRYVTLLRYSVSSGTAISVDTQFAVRFSRMTFAHTGTPTGGSCIVLTSTPAGTVNQWSVFRDCSFDGLVDCIHTVKAMTWIIDNCIFAGYTGSAVHVQNDDNGDGGDSLIHGGCIFNGVGVISIGVHQVSSGGLKIANCKFVSGAYGYLMTLSHGVQTGDLLMVNNSIENMTVAGIQMNRISGGALDMHFSNVTIVGNQFLGTATGIPINLNDADPNWLLGVTITGNQVDISHAGASQYGIFVNSAQAFNITGNSVMGAAPSIGIAVGAGALGGVIGANSLAGFAQGISNLSPSTSVAKKVLQGTTGNITTSNVIGPVFEAVTPVLFPAGFFGQTPKVTATIETGVNGISACAFNPTTSGVSIRGVGVTNATVVTVAWRAESDY